ncbi:MAG TPA: hypothetical protein VIR38_05400 [Thalassobaculum sp.]
MSARIFCVVAVAATVAGSLSGCSTYMDAKADALAGGPQQRVAAAQSNLTAAQTRNQDLQDQQLALQRDIERNEKRIAAAQSDLDKTKVALADARAKKRLSEQEYAKLRKESDALNSELAKLDLQLQADRGKAGAGPDVAAKEARLRELERRKSDLDRAIKAALGA